MHYRTSYLRQLKLLSGKGLISILVGIRRVGKSTILKQYMQEVGEEKCLYIAKELQQFDDLQTHEQLYTYIEAHLGDKQYICIDEVQLVHDRQKTINALRAKYENTRDIIITGSNSDLLSTEISTLLRGRTFEIKVYPFSFHEFCDYHDLEKSATNMMQFLQQGGLPALYMLDESQKQTWIEGLINTVFLNDIVQRYSIRDVELLRSIFYYLMQSISDQSNLANIKNYLKQKSYAINLNTIGNYVYYITHSLLLHEVDMYDMQGKKMLDRARKFYSADHALRGYLFSGYDTGIGKIVENYCYIALCRAGYQVCVGKLATKEIDFIAEKNGKKLYVQASYILTDQEVITREFAPLQMIDDNRPKVVVSMDMLSFGVLDGIDHIQLRSFEEYLEKNAN